MINSKSIMTILFLTFLLGAGLPSHSQLTPHSYEQTCPNLFSIIRSIINDTMHNSDPRIAASLVRLHFHDCFVQGCDGSILLDNTDAIESEKDALPNLNSARGFEVIDAIKTAIENKCPGVVSCADILTIAAEESIFLAGGPNWIVFLGRRDSLTASRTTANTFVPAPFETLAQLKAKFAAVGLNTTDLVSLSGAHTFGRAQCSMFRDRLYNFNNTGKPDQTMDPDYREQLKALCPEAINSSNLANLDPTTPNGFDSSYFTSRQFNKGLLQSDQELFSTSDADTIDIVNRFTNQSAFFDAFVKSMLKMGNIKLLTGRDGEIRVNCRRVNADSVQSNEGFASLI